MRERERVKEVEHPRGLAHCPWGERSNSCAKGQDREQRKIERLCINIYICVHICRV